MSDLLSPHQLLIANRVLDEESRARRHLVISLSGAHAYGFPSPDSDLDLKAIHIEPQERFLGLSSPTPAPDRLEVLDGVEIDYSSNELQPALLGILSGNGNYLERILGSNALRTSPAHEALRPLVRAALSRRFYRHYLGFAGSQRREFETAAAPTAKSVLYALRTTLTGAHLLRTGEVVTDLTALLDDYQLGEARALVEQKRAGERVTLDDAARAHWTSALDRAFAALDAAHASSPLPDEPPNRPALDAWLISLRQSP
jgi:uncharacterized protein